MSVLTTVSVARKNQPMADHILVQIDNVSPLIAPMLGGAVPENTYTLYSLCGIPDIQTGDLLTDERTSVQYRVRGNPEAFDDNHLEAQLDRVVGS